MSIWLGKACLPADFTLVQCLKPLKGGGNTEIKSFLSPETDRKENKNPKFPKVEQELKMFQECPLPVLLDTYRIPALKKTPLKYWLDWKWTIKSSGLRCSSLIGQLHGSFAWICWHGSEFGVQDWIVQHSVQHSVHWALNEQIIPVVKRANFYLALMFPPICVILCLCEREWGGKANISLPPGLQTVGRDALVTPVTAPDLILCCFRCHSSESMSLLCNSTQIWKAIFLQLVDTD